MLRTLSKIVRGLAIIFCLFLNPAKLFAHNANNHPATDTIPAVRTAAIKDSVIQQLDSAKKIATSLIRSRYQNTVSKTKDLIPDSLSKPTISISRPTIENVFAGKPLFKFNGAIVNYNFFYRANIDTPYAQKDVHQHTLTGNILLTIADKFPIKITYLARKSNSLFFRDIYDARAEFDATAFRNKLNTNLTQQLTSTLDNFKDSLTEKLYLLKLDDLNNLREWINNPLTLQQLYEMNEIARMPSLTYDKRLPDSLAKRRSDSLQQQAKFFLDQYSKRKAQYEGLTHDIDSLKKVKDNTLAQIRKLRQMLNDHNTGRIQPGQLKNELAQFTGSHLSIPKQYQWLLNIRKLSVGRSPVNYSELTAKNISLNGINFEYNSWYYLAVTAGLVDYRFRDFSTQPFKKSPQYMYMLRLGVGQLEKNYVIVSFFQGRKQLYTSENARKGIPVTGISIESKYQLAKHTYLIAEAAESVSPDFNYNPPGEKKMFNLSDRSNKALSFKLYSYLQKTRTRFEGLYKYTGANYQSFTSFQTNATFVSWYVKADQQFFKRQLKVSASVKKNDFSNPYIVQQYSTNSLFKTLQLSFHKKKWPSASIAYLPVSQYSKLDNQIIENRFHTLNASINHIYKLGTQQTATSVVVNRFYNAMSDSAFTYFNALNFILSQNFFFKSFDAGFSIMQTKNPDHVLNVLDGNVQIPVLRKAHIGLGAKLNNLNKQTVKLGYYGNVQYRFKEQDVLYISLEKGYLTGIKNNLVRNDFVTISFSKHFN